MGNNATKGGNSVMNTKKLLALILAFTVILCAVPVVYADITIEPGEGEPVVPESGDIAVDTDDLPAPDTGNECGNGLTWDLTGNVLTISAADGSEGTMTNYTADNPAPWSESAASITTVEIAEGVTTIGDYAFAGCTGLTDVKLKYTETIGAKAFAGCTGLTRIRMGYVTSIGEGAFDSCTSAVVYCQVNYKDHETFVAARETVSMKYLGDANGDGYVNSIDALLMKRKDAGFSNVPIHDEYAADCNDDGSINSIDALFAKRNDAGYTTVPFV